MACVFIEMLSMRRAKAKKQMENISMGVLTLKPINSTATPSRQKAVANGIRLSYFDTNQPESGKPAMELMGMKSKMVPSSASVK